MSRMRVPRRVLKLLPAGLLAIGVAVAAGGVVLARQTDAPRTIPVTLPSSPTAAPVAPLAKRIPTNLLVTSATAIPAGTVKRLVAATGARAALLVSAGRVFVEKGQTTALGVDPSTFRAWTPKGTAESTAVWQSVAAGDGAVAHVVGRAFELPLGGEALMQATFPLEVRVGSFTTTAIPGIGLVVSSARALELGLTPATGLLLSVPQRDSAVSARLARAAAPGLAVSAVQYARLPAVRRGWVVPVVGRVTSGFGWRIHPITHQRKLHEGVDIAAPLGSAVYAMADGVVLYAGPARGYGNEVVLSHPGGVTTVYGHMSRIVVTSGAVRAGDVIALVGSEGDSTGPHLHAEVRVDDQPVDPLGWLRAHGVRL
jgi:hypothetical protein